MKPNFDLETEYIAKKPTNGAFQRYVCRMEMLSSFRMRIGNISPSATQCISTVKVGKTPKSLLPLARRGPSSNTAMPQPTARTTPYRNSVG